MLKKYFGFLFVLILTLVGCSNNNEALQGSVKNIVSSQSQTSEDIQQIKADMEELKEQTQEVVDTVKQLNSEYDIDKDLIGVYNAQDATDGIAQTVLTVVENTSGSYQTIYGYTAFEVNGEPKEAFTGAFVDNKVVAMKYPLIINTETKEMSIDKNNGEPFAINFEKSEDGDVKFYEIRVSLEDVKAKPNQDGSQPAGPDLSKAWDGLRVNFSEDFQQRIDEIFNLEGE